jgi:hypothetical protein
MHGGSDGLVPYAEQVGCWKPAGARTAAFLRVIQTLSAYPRARPVLSMRRQRCLLSICHILTLRCRRAVVNKFLTAFRGPEAAAQKLKRMYLSWKNDFEVRGGPRYVV